MFIRRMFNFDSVHLSTFMRNFNFSYLSEIMEGIGEDAFPKNLLSQRMWETYPNMLYKEMLTKYFQI